MRAAWLLSGLLLCGMACAQNVTIAEGGKTSYVIVIPDEADSVLRNAAQELSDHLNKATGADFSIYELAARPQGKKYMYVGAVVPGAMQDFSKAPADTTAIAFKNGDIYFDGRMPRGPLYAVYTFLEDYVGVRWWTPEEKFIPGKPTLVINGRDYLYSPQIRSRETFYLAAEDARFAPRLKANGHFARIAPEWGGKMSIIGWCHTFFQFLPPEKYFKDHPEWYSEINGKRQAGRTQLCLTNEEMKAEFVKVCLERIARNPTAGLISVSQNDWHGRCECAKCRAVEAEEGSPSGLLVRFVNSVAEEVGKQYPDFLFETLAYQYTRKAPKITHPAKNVVIRLCSIEMNFAQPLETGPDNVSFKRDIEEWSSMAPNLYIWNYITNFRNYMLPHPNWRPLGQDIRFFANHHAIGVFEQGDAKCRIGDFVRARAWVVAHLLWNPNQDEKALMKEFFNGYYGAAGPYLLEYIDYLCDKVEEAKFNLRCYVGESNGWLPIEALDKALAIYKKAEEAVADNNELAVRVRRERLPLDLACLQAVPKILRWERYTGKKYTVNFPVEPKRLAQEFNDLCMLWNVGNISEGEAFGDYGKKLMESLEVTFTERGEAPEWCKGLAPDRWDHFTPNRFRLHNQGQWVFIVDDAAATTGKAAKMTNRHNQWATQIQVDGYYGMVKKWKFRFAVRCDAKSREGLAMCFGVYSNAKGRDLVHRDIQVRDIAGDKYIVFETEPIQLGQEQYVWFAPVERKPEDVEAIYIDYVSMIREE